MKIQKIIGFIVVIAAIMVAIGSNLEGFIDVPSLIIVFGITIGAILNSGRSISQAVGAVFKCSLSADEYRIAADTWRKTEDYLVGSGVMGTLIGCIIMLKNIDDPAAIGPGLAIGILTVLYSVYLKYFICKPIVVSLLDKVWSKEHPDLPMLTDASVPASSLLTR
tara:strand:+ start:11583 stop:12077 length:495 start_codon:yes stop_codon:yes gene_type:complete